MVLLEKLVHCIEVQADIVVIVPQDDLYTSSVSFDIS